VTPIRAGVIGVGRLGAEHARLLAASPAFDLVGVCDRDPDRARAVGSAVGAPALDDEALASAVDAVVVAVPTAAHAAVAAPLLEAGRHVLVEKPLAPTLDDARGLVALAARSGRVLGVGHVERFNGILLACEPHLGRIRYVDSQRLAAFQPRGTDVTVVLDLMIHDIDLVLGLIPAPLADVQAIGTAVLTDSLDLANARLTFENGAVANISASRVSMKPLRQLRLFQDTGYSSLDLAAGTGEHYRRRRTGVPGEPLARELEAFAAAIRGEPSRLVRGARGLEALEVAGRITRAIEASEGA
jgi:predicted dehydrogenase